jgi:carboxyl-terminal processing protease
MELFKGFKPGKPELEALRNYTLSVDSIPLNSFNQIEAQQLSQRMQILMARQIWRTQGYYEVANQFDPAVLKGLSLLK